jgi:metal-responsive CopG/Arc/MetJ family transcriptional regulator
MQNKVKDRPGQLVHIHFEDQILKKLDDYRFKRRFGTRSKALKALLLFALKQNPELNGDKR